MPFGLCNAGATYQRLMDLVLSGLNLEVCLVYLDDIVVYSKSVKQHLERLDAVLTRLEQAGLKLKPENANCSKSQCLSSDISSPARASERIQKRLE